MTWTKPKPMLRHERELWIEALLDAAEGDDEILSIAKDLRIAVNERRGKTSRFGMESALELLAALGAWMIENEVRDDRQQNCEMPEVRDLHRANGDA